MELGERLQLGLFEKAQASVVAVDRWKENMEAFGRKRGERQGHPGYSL